jgi:hypothetical protein
MNLLQTIKNFSHELSMFRGLYYVRIVWILKKLLITQLFNYYLVNIDGYIYMVKIVEEGGGAFGWYIFGCLCV